MYVDDCKILIDGDGKRLAVMYNGELFYLQCSTKTHLEMVGEFNRQYQAEAEVEASKKLMGCGSWVS